MNRYRFIKNASIVLGLAYIVLLVIVPNLYLLYRSFGWGFREPMEPYLIAALANTGIVVVVSLLVTVPLGLLTAIVLVRDDRRWTAPLDAVIDLPFAAPAAISAFALLLFYGPHGFLGPFLEPLGIQIVFRMPGMILATIFVTLPFVVREVAPLLEELGTEAEEAARTLGASPWQTLRRVTIPGVSDGLIYGAALSYARALGEFGAILIISGNILGDTQTMPLYIYNSYTNFRMDEAFQAAALLMAIGLAGTFALEAWRNARSPEKAA